MVDITKLVIDNIYIIAPAIFVFIYAYWNYFRSTKEDFIADEVMFFFHGGTFEFFPALVEQNHVWFKPSEEGEEIAVPIVRKPRVNYRGGQTRRTYLVAEGLGETIDIPPLTREDREKILAVLFDAGIIEKNEDGKPVDSKGEIIELKDVELFNYVKFYNFDFEQITGKPQMERYSTSMNVFNRVVGGLVDRARMEEQSGGNVRMFIAGIIGLAMGFFIAYSLTLKGVI